VSIAIIEIAYKTKQPYTVPQAASGDVFDGALRKPKPTTARVAGTLVDAPFVCLGKNVSIKVENLPASRAASRGLVFK
jgi:hypothetical protein